MKTVRIILMKVTDVPRQILDKEQVVAVTPFENQLALVIESEPGFVEWKEKQGG